MHILTIRKGVEGKTRNFKGTRDVFQLLQTYCSISLNLKITCFRKETVFLVRWAGFMFLSFGLFFFLFWRNHSGLAYVYAISGALSSVTTLQSLNNFSSLLIRDSWHFLLLPEMAPRNMKRNVDLNLGVYSIRISFVDQIAIGCVTDMLIKKTRSTNAWKKSRWWTKTSPFFYSGSLPLFYPAIW
jgi:hypothetical protein